jgi:hypothetical protein
MPNARSAQKHERRLEEPDARCPKHPNKEYRRLVEAAWRAGWWCERRRKYIYCRPPDKKSGIVKIPMTPHRRTIHNVRRNLRVRGLDV